MRLSLQTAPTVEPITLTDAKLHLHLAVDEAGAVAYTAEDDLLTVIIKAARQVAETEAWKAYAPAVWDLFLDEWPAGNEIRLPWPPLTAVTHVKYTTSDGTLITLSTDDYTVDTASTPGRIVLGYDKSWPSETLAPMNPIQIRFSAGYEAADVPATTIIGMKLVITDLFENRGDTIVGRMVTPIQLPRAASHYFAMDSARGF